MTWSHFTGFGFSLSFLLVIRIICVIRVIRVMHILVILVILVIRARVRRYRPASRGPSGEPRAAPGVDLPDQEAGKGVTCHLLARLG